MNKPAEGFYVPKGMIAIWLGREFVDLGIDWVECHIILHEDRRHAVISGDIKLVDDLDPNT